MKGKYYEIEASDDPARVEYPDKAETGAVGPCLIIGILNRKKKIGYLGHYVWLDENGPEALVDRAVKEADCPSDLEAVLAGNQALVASERIFIQESEEEDFDTPEHIDELTNEHGQWAVNMVKSKGVKRVSEYFLPKSRDLFYAIIIDTEKNKIIVEEELDE